MNKKAIIYLHGFNSASLDMQGNLLVAKEKLYILDNYCKQNTIKFFTPNVDYRDFQQIIDDILLKWNHFFDRGYDITFIGSSMGGFACEYFAMMTGNQAIMINPAFNPSKILQKFIGVSENYETGQSYSWKQTYCDQYVHYEKELLNYSKPIDRIVLLDMGDELLDSAQTYDVYKEKAKVITFEGGSHAFEHMQDALPIIEQAIFNS